MKFNSKKLIFYKSILQNESLTSWICRNALSNYQSPIGFVKYWVNPHKALNYDFDEQPIAELNFWLSSHGRDNCLLKADLNYRTKIKSAFTLAKSDSSAISKLGSFKSIKQYPPQFCPCCLCEFEPYFRFEWQFTIIFACDRCNCFLETQCKKCETPIQLMRHKVIHDNSFKKIYNCAFCYHHLGKADIIILSNEQKELNNAIHQLLGLIDKSEINEWKVSLLLDVRSIGKRYKSSTFFLDNHNRK